MRSKLIWFCAIMWAISIAVMFYGAAIQSGSFIFGGTGGMFLGALPVICYGSCKDRSNVEEQPLLVENGGVVFADSNAVIAGQPAVVVVPSSDAERRVCPSVVAVAPPSDAERRAKEARIWEERFVQQAIDSHSVPLEFICSITRQIMRDPVVNERGHTYEREAIERWYRDVAAHPDGTRDPLDNVLIKSFTLIQNQDLKGRIMEWKEVGGRTLAAADTISAQDEEMNCSFRLS